MDEQPDYRPETWDDWSRRHRDRKERADLEISVRGRRAQAGLAHEAAHRAFRVRCWMMTVITAIVAAPLAAGWVFVIAARDRALEGGFGDVSYAPAGFTLLALTAGATAVVVAAWLTVIGTRPAALRLEEQPDAPDAPRHPAFRQKHEPPHRS